jgi:hypothetical protein
MHATGRSRCGDLSARTPAPLPPANAMEIQSRVLETASLVVSDEP